MKFTTVVLAVFGIIASASAAPTAESDIVIKLSPELHKRLPEAELTELIKSTILKSRDLELEALVQSKESKEIRLLRGPKRFTTNQKAGTCVRG
ncbi:hypothetical protein TWF679_003933 [Orbilia oligospora]|uniref:Uncharacterized protein n=1 Tax=Orbilia oligospora TaxID=2813651 RepID=A0A8H8VEG0_ORBOL|nr:hypothetical protein TWF679_003933 [Orbilia oligospora]